MLPRALLATAAAALLGAALPTASAQSIWGITGPAVRLDHTAGPPVGPCAYPTGPLVGGFFYAPTFCPGPGPFPGPAPGALQVGDVTVDRGNDTVWATDGAIVAGYTKAGAIFSSFPNPLPGLLTGLGYQAPAGAALAPVLWLTDGALAMAVIPPPVCPGPIAIAVPPFPVVLPGLCTDIDYDPVSGTLFESNVNGLIANQVVGGGVGPFGVFPPLAPCPLPPLQTGIAVDTASCKALFVAAGGMVARVDFTGAPAPVTFYAPVPCWPWAGIGPTSGLGFDATPVHFCKGSDPAGPPPVAGTINQALTPAAAFGITLTGAAPGGTAFLLVGAAPVCPTIPIGFGCFICTAPIVLTIGPLPVPLSGNVGLPAPIPGGLGCSGALAFAQWVVVKPGGAGLQTSQTLHIRPAVP